MTFIRMKESISLDFDLRRNNVDETSSNENMFYRRLRFHSLVSADKNVIRNTVMESRIVIKLQFEDT